MQPISFLKKPSFFQPSILPSSFSGLPRKIDLFTRFIFNYWILALSVTAIGVGALILHRLVKKNFEQRRVPVPPPPISRRPRRENPNRHSPPIVDIQPPAHFALPHLQAPAGHPPIPPLPLFSPAEQRLFEAIDPILPKECAIALVANGFPIPHQMHVIQQTAQRTQLHLTYHHPLNGTVTTRTDIPGLAGCHVHMPEGGMIVTLDAQHKKIDFSGKLFSASQKKTNCLDAIRDRVNMLNRFNQWAAMRVVNALPDVLQIHFSSLSLNKNGSIGFDFQVAGPLNALLTALKLCVDFSLPKEEFLRLFAPGCVAWQQR